MLNDFISRYPASESNNKVATKHVISTPDISMMTCIVVELLAGSMEMN